MNQNVNHTTRPAWLSLASGTFKAMQHRKAPRQPSYGIDDNDPLGELISAPDHVPLMIDLADEWSALNGTDHAAFSAKRSDRTGATVDLLATLRLCATLGDREAAEALADPSAVTVIDVGHTDWVQPVSRALQDILPDHTLFHDADDRKAGDLLVLIPFVTDALATAKEKAKFGKTVADALARETAILIITAGNPAWPDSLARCLPPAVRLAPIDAQIVLAMLHLRFEDGDARHHARLVDQMPSSPMLARLGFEALHLAFRATDAISTVETLAVQAAGLIQSVGATLDEMDASSPAVMAARQMVCDLHLWSKGELAWSDCLHSLLLHGRPGTGKTYLARALGNSSGVPLFIGSLARWQAAGHLGDCLRAMHEFIATAIAAAPCIIFIDEIDAAGSRETGDKQGSNYWRMLVNGFLEQIDSVIRTEGVLLIGACNNVAALDPAIVRPGRFDQTVEVPLPTGGALSAMVQRQLGQDLSKSDITEITAAAVGATPAVIDGAIRAARSHARSLGRGVQSRDVINRLQNGNILDPALMWRIAIHECGHVVLAADRVLGEVTQVRVGQQSGRTTITPDIGCGLPRDHRDLLAYTLGGRAAEMVIFGSVGSGSGGRAPTCDLAFATRTAIEMETALGFGLDGLIWSPADTSTRITDPVLRAAVQKQLQRAEGMARRVLEGHKVLLLEMAKDLLRHRILEGAALQSWIDRIVGDAPWDPEDPSGRRAAAADAALMEGSTVIHLRDYRLDAPS